MDYTGREVPNITRSTIYVTLHERREPGSQDSVVVECGWKFKHQPLVITLTQA